MNTSKLDPRARKCVFVGIASNKKWYKCFDPITKRLFVTMDALFFENQPFFKPHLRGEKGLEDLEDSSYLDFLRSKSDLDNKSNVGEYISTKLSQNRNKDPSFLGDKYLIVLGDKYLEILGDKYPTILGDKYPEFL